MHSLTLCAVVGLSAVLLAGDIHVAAQPSRQGPDGDRYTIVVDVDLAVFSVAVTDGKGRHVPGLKAKDFRVYEDGQLQDIALFNAEDVPVSIGLLIDSSGSMRGKMTDVANAALSFVQESNPLDEIFVVNFNEHVYLGLPPAMPFTSDLAQIRSALLGNVPDGMTALYDALAAGIDHLKMGTLSRKALVVLSDGGDNASRHGLADVSEMARRSNATIHAIGIYDEVNLDRNPRALRSIATLTGGRAYFPQNLHDLGGVWRDIAGAIRTQYSIGYHSTNPARDGGLRKVRITAGRSGGRGLQVASRDSYYAPVGQK